MGGGEGGRRLEGGVLAFEYNNKINKPGSCWLWHQHGSHRPLTFTRIHMPRITRDRTITRSLQL